MGEVRPFKRIQIKTSSQIGSRPAYFSLARKYEKGGGGSLLFFVRAWYYRRGSGWGG